MEGAPDIMLSLGVSGYQVVKPTSQQEPLVTSNPNISTTLPATGSPEELVVPSLQQSLEKPLTIPMETETSTPSTPFVDDLIVPSSQETLEASLTIPAESETSVVHGPFRFAPRVIPAWDID